MAFHLAASHLQHEREQEAAPEQLVAQARAGAPRGPLASARARLAMRLIRIALALGGDSVRQPARDALRPRSMAA